MGSFLKTYTNALIYVLHLTVFYKYMSCVSEIAAKATCTGFMMMYADGIEVGRHNNKETVGHFKMPANTKVVAMSCIGDTKVGNVGGIIAQFDIIDAADYITDSTWKCSENDMSEWFLQDFNDTSWPYAVSLAYNRHPSHMPELETVDNGELKSLADIVDHAQYIWTNRYKFVIGHSSVYCRGHIGLEPSYNHYGRRFVVAFMDNDNETKLKDVGTVGISVQLVTAHPTWLTVYCYTPLATNHTFAKIQRIWLNKANVLELPDSLRHKGSVTMENNVLICVSTAPISITGVNQQPQRTDKFLALPIEQLGSEQDSMEYYALVWDKNDGGYNGRLLLVAIYDSTLVQVHPGDTITYGGKVTKKGAMFEIQLKKYASCQFANDDNFSGTRLVSNKPFVLYCGNKLTVVKNKISEGTTESNLVEQMIPVKCWGRKFILPPLTYNFKYRYKSQLSWYKIIASEADTEVVIKFYKEYDFKRMFSKILGAGSSIKWAHMPGESAYVEATSGILVSQFATSVKDSHCVGNAWQMLIPPIELYFNYYQVTPRNLYFEKEQYQCNQYNFITLIVSNKDKRGIIIDDTEIDKLTGVYIKYGFHAIPRTDYSFMNIYIDKSQPVVRHSNPSVNFGLLSFSYARLDAYATMAGIRLAPVNKPCEVVMSSAPGDGLDNNCDGSVDNKLCARHLPFTDCSVLRPINGNWAAWKTYGPCDCKRGEQVSTRTCSVPVVQYRGMPCKGEAVKTESCTCHRTDGGWTEWSPWGQCTGSCLDGASRDGEGTRTRSCSNPFPLNGGKGCTGQGTQKEPCTMACIQDLKASFKSACKFDLVILVDRSDSLLFGTNFANRFEFWDQTIDFLKAFVNALRISEEHVQIALVSFSTDTKLEFDFGTDLQTLVKRIDGISRPMGLTCTAMALQEAYNLFTDDRSDADNLVLLLTDGEPTVYLNGTKRNTRASQAENAVLRMEAITMADKLRNEKKIKALLTVGVTNRVSEVFLMELAGSEDNYKRVNQFSDLLGNLGLILSATCNLGKDGLKQKFIREPGNVAVVQGNKAIMKCTGPNSVQQKKHTQVWEDLRDSSKPITMSSNWNIVKQYLNTVEFDGMYHLQFKNTTTTFSGQYCCLDTTDRKNKRCAELIVLESEPALTLEIEGDDTVVGSTVRYVCQVKYSGRWGPVMLWTDKYHENLLSTDMSTTAMTKTMVEFEATREDNNREFTCTTNFGELLVPKPGKREAANVPDYTHKTTSDPLIVYYPPENTRIVDISGEIVVELLKLNLGEKLTCLTDSNPKEKDTYEWTTEAGKEIGTDPEITVTAEFLEAQVITCTVRNTLGEDSAEVTILEESKSVSSDGMVTTLTVGGLLGLLLLVGLCLLLTLIRRKKKKKEEESISPTTQADAALHVAEPFSANKKTTNKVTFHEPDRRKETKSRSDAALRVAGRSSANTVATNKADLRKTASSRSEFNVFGGFDDW